MEQVNDFKNDDAAQQSYVAISTDMDEGLPEHWASLQPEEDLTAEEEEQATAYRDPEEYVGTKELMS